MAICNKDFRVKHGLYVGTDIDASRGALSALSTHIGGGYGDTGLTVTNTGNLSTDGTITAACYNGVGTDLTTNFTISAGGDVDNVTANVTALNGTYCIPLELKNTGVTASEYGSASAIPTFTVDEDGRLTAAGTVPVSGLSVSLEIAGDTGTGTVNLGSEVLTIAGTSNEIETSAAGGGITIGLPDNVTITGDLTVNGNDIKDSGGSPALTFDGSQNTTAQGNFTVEGNFIVNGDTTTQNVSALTVEDPVIKLASNNVADTVDIGFYGRYRVGAGTNTSDNRYAGLIRDTTLATTSAAFVFFDGSTTDILSGNATSNAEPTVSEYADVYVGGLGIGTNASLASYALTINGDVSGNGAALFDSVTTAGNLTVNGNTILGNNSGDTVTINASTVDLPGIGTSTDNSVVIYTGSSLATDEIDPKVWDIKLVDYNGISTANRLSKYIDGSGTIDNSRISDDATDIVLGVGETNPVTFTGSSTTTSVKYNDTTGYHSLSTTVNAAASNVAVFTKPAADFRSGKVVIQSAVGSTQYEVAELLLIHDGTDVHVTQYGNISTQGTFCTDYTADINAGNVRILASNNHGTVNAVVTTAVQQFLI